MSLLPRWLSPLAFAAFLLVAPAVHSVDGPGRRLIRPGGAQLLVRSVSGVANTEPESSLYSAPVC